MAEKTLEALFECKKGVDAEIIKFKEYWKIAQPGIDLDSAPKSEIAKMLHAYLVPEKKAKRVAAEGETFIIRPAKNVFRFSRKYYFVNDLLNTREGQCQVFTSLFCIMARRLGMNAVGVSVLKDEHGKKPPAGHVCALVEIGNGQYLFDLTRHSMNAKHLQWYVISDNALYASALHTAGKRAVEGFNYTLALKYFKQALAFNPQYVRAWSSLGDVYLKLKMYKEGRDAFEMAATLSKNKKRYSAIVPL